MHEAALRSLRSEQRKIVDRLNEAKSQAIRSEGRAKSDRGVANRLEIEYLSMTTTIERLEKEAEREQSQGN